MMKPFVHKYRDFTTAEMQWNVCPLSDNESATLVLGKLMGDERVVRFNMEAICLVSEKVWVV